MADLLPTFCSKKHMCTAKTSFTMQDVWTWCLQFQDGNPWKPGSVKKGCACSSRLFFDSLSRAQSSLAGSSCAAFGLALWEELQRLSGGGAALQPAGCSTCFDSRDTHSPNAVASHSTLVGNELEDMSPSESDVGDDDTTIKEDDAKSLDEEDAEPEERRLVVERTYPPPKGCSAISVWHQYTFLCPWKGSTKMTAGVEVSTSHHTVDSLLLVSHHSSDTVPRWHDCSASWRVAGFDEVSEAPVERGCCLVQEGTILSHCSTRSACSHKAEEAAGQLEVKLLCY
jgi:hypothetical protein